MSDATVTSLRVLIVDDEPLARARTRRLLEEVGGNEIVGEAGSVPEARDRVATFHPDVVLLDIQMPGEDGFALLEGLDPRPAIVFVTAFDSYAVRAFEEHALDYLLKPFRKERLAEALERARRDLSKPDELAHKLAELLAARPLERFTVRVGTRQLILKAEEVVWFGAEDKLVFAATDNDRHWVNFTLDVLEKRLDPQRFFRTHRAAIVNLDFAAALRQGFAGTYSLQLKDRAQSEVPVSRARARALRDKLGA